MNPSEPDKQEVKRLEYLGPGPDAARQPSVGRRILAGAWGGFLGMFTVGLMSKWGAEHPEGVARWVALIYAAALIAIVVRIRRFIKRRETGPFELGAMIGAGLACLMIGACFGTVGK